MKNIYFQSSLPRSGSTVFQNVIGQNPDFYVTPTSGVLELVYAARVNYSNSPEFKAQDSEEMKNSFLNFCNQGLQGFYCTLTDKPNILDKSRGWGIHYRFLNSFYPNPKIVCMIRDPRDIFSSLEKKFRENQHLDAGIVNHANMSGTTTEKRIDIWANSQPIGLAMERLQQIVTEGIDKHILFIKFEDFCRNPEREVKRFYTFIDKPYYAHDFDNVEQLTVEDDDVYGIYGDHKIRKKIEPLRSTSKEVLGSHACNWIRGNYKWFYDRFNYQ